MDRTRLRTACAVAGVGAMVFSVLLEGCGGGGGTAAGPTAGKVTVSGLVAAPAGAAVASASRADTGVLAWLLGTEAYALAGNTPVPNALATIYRFSNGEPLGHATTDANGRYSIDVPDGLDVLIVAETATLRLSKLLADVSPSNRTADLDATTTLAAEAFGAVYYKKTSNISQQDIGLVETVAGQQLANFDSLNLTVGAGLIPSAFGGGINAPPSLRDAIQAIEQQVPASQNLQVSLAKALVQELRDSGTSLRNAFESELVAQRTVIEDEVIATFGALGQRLGFVGRVLFEQVVVVPARARAESTQTYNILTLPDGTYQEQPASQAWYGPFELVLTGSAPAGQAIIHAAQSDTAANGLVVTVTRPVGVAALLSPSVAFSVTSTEDAALDYHGTATASVTGLMTITQVALTASFEDSELTTPITAVGTLSGTPATKAAVPPYTQLVFTGEVTSATVKASVGSWTAKFSGTIPAGAPLDAMWAQYPTAFALKDLSLETVGTTSTMKLTGDLDVTFGIAAKARGRGVAGRGQYLAAIPTGFTFTGTYAGKAVTAFTGTLGATWTNPSFHGDTIPQGTATVSGVVSTPGQPDTSVDLTVTSEGTSPATMELTLTRGTMSLTGTATATLDSNGDFTQGSLSLQSEGGLKINVAATNGGDSVTGTVTTASGVKLADIEVDSALGTVAVHYADGTSETL